MDKFDWLVETLIPRGQLRSVLNRCGVPYQLQHGRMLTLKSLASNWVIQVSSLANNKGWQMNKGT